MGNYFKSANEIYDIYETLFERLMSDPALSKKLLALGKCVNIKFTDYEAEITLDIEGEKWKFIKGPPENPVEIVLWLNSTSAHRLWTGKITPLSAIMSREIRVKGPIRALTDIDTLFSASKEIYKQILTEKGRSNIL